ncbi:MAG: hypothetical protein RR911_02075 [Oscillospiraceae bacterium]
MSINEIRNAYKMYLQNQNLSVNTVNTSCTDTFYLWRKDSPELFWKTVLSFDFETEAKETLTKTLNENSNGNVETIISGYMSHLRRFRLFLKFNDVFETSPASQMQINEFETTHQSITEENIERQHHFVESSDNYGKEGRIIHDVLNAFPLNNDLNTIAMKIAVIDVTNSTHLSQYKSKISLYDLAKIILDIPNIDKRLENGDTELVNIIAKNNGLVNMFSFASKYCTYHNVEIYGKDDYSIFDGIVKNTLPYYIEGLTANQINNWRVNFNYSAFNECIGKLLDENGIKIPFRRRKFDHFLWYANR